MAFANFLLQLGASKSKGDKDFKKWIKHTTGFSPKNTTLYKQAFLHSSVINKKGNTSPSNERLEFLGDAILGAIIAEHVFKLYPFKDEGFLTQLRSKIVNGQHLKELALKFGFNDFLKASLSINEKTKSSAYGDAFEAFIGAVYVDIGYDKTKKFIIQKIIKPHVHVSELAITNDDYKSQLQIYCQKNKFTLEYKLLSETKQGANKIYVIQTVVNGIEYVSFENYSKRLAEQKAAQLTLEELQKQHG